MKNFLFYLQSYQRTKFQSKLNWMFSRVFCRISQTSGRTTSLPRTVENFAAVFAKFKASFSKYILWRKCWVMLNIIAAAQYPWRISLYKKIGGPSESFPSLNNLWTVLMYSLHVMFFMFLNQRKVWNQIIYVSTIFFNHFFPLYRCINNVNIMIFIHD